MKPSPSSPEVKNQEHTPGPWTVHKSFPEYVVPLGHERKSIGGAVDADVEARDFAKVIARETYTEFPEFHRTRLLPEEARANARLIAAAPDMGAFLLRLRDNDVPDQQELEALLQKAGLI